MKTKFGICIALALASLAGAAMAKGGHGGHSSHGGANPGGSHHVSGYTKKDGSHVAPHQATNPNDSKRDNWSSKGNVNPHTGKEGNKDPDAPAK